METTNLRRPQLASQSNFSHASAAPSAVLHGPTNDLQDSHNIWQTLEDDHVGGAQPQSDKAPTTAAFTDHFLRATHYFDLVVQHIQAILPVDLCLILTQAGIDIFAEQIDPPAPMSGQHRNTAANLTKQLIGTLYHASYQAMPIERQKLLTLWGYDQMAAHLERWRTGFSESRPLYIPALPSNSKLSGAEPHPTHQHFDHAGNVEDVDESQPFLGALLLLPIKYRNQVIGLLHLQTRQTNGFTATHFHLLSSLTPLIGSYLHEAQQANQAQQAHLAAAHDRALLGRRIVDFTAQITSLKTELAMAQRIKDDFLAVMSHELRTPLTVIMTRGELMLSNAAEHLSQRQHDSLLNIDKHAKQLLTTINNMLDLVSADSGHIILNLEPINTAAICRKIISDIQEEAGSHQLQVKLKLHPQTRNIVADGYRLTQMLTNLLQNAIKFTPHGGAIGLEETYDAKAQMVHFHVWDTGIGIVPNAQSHIFEPFFQFDSSLTRFYEGSGLGLAMVARLAELHGGQISVSSTPGQGTRFTLALPVKASIPEAERAERQTPPFHFQRAFVIDSHAESIESLIAWLVDWGIQPHLQPHTHDVVANILNFYPDVILIDLTADKGRGWKALNQILTVNHLRHIPIVTLFSSHSPAHKQDAAVDAQLLRHKTSGDNTDSDNTDSDNAPSDKASNHQASNGTAVTKDALFHALERAQNMKHTHSVIVAAE